MMRSYQKWAACIIENVVVSRRMMLGLLLLLSAPDTDISEGGICRRFSTAERGNTASQLTVCMFPALWSWTTPCPRRRRRTGQQPTWTLPVAARRPALGQRVSPALPSSPLSDLLQLVSSVKCCTWRHMSRLTLQVLGSMCELACRKLVVVSMEGSLCFG